MGAVVRGIKENPEQDRRLYRLLAVNGMILAGLGSEQIAGRHPVHQALTDQLGEHMLHPTQAPAAQDRPRAS